MVFFNMAGYLFVDWNEYSQCLFHDSDVTLCWAAPFGPAVEKNSHIPLCTSYEDFQVERALELKREVELKKEDGEHVERDEDVQQDGMRRIAHL